MVIKGTTGDPFPSFPSAKLGNAYFHNIFNSTMEPEKWQKCQEFALHESYFYVAFDVTQILDIDDKM